MIDIIKKIPISQIALGLISSYRDHYIVVFLFALFFFSPSLATFLLVVIGSFFNHLLINIVHQYREMIIVSLMVEGKLKPVFQSPTKWLIEKIPMQSFTDKDTYNEIKEIPIFKIQGKSLDEKVNIYRLHIDKENNEGVTAEITSNIVCFSRPFNDSFIFIDINPKKMKSLSKFKVLHEIGHAILSPFFIDTKRQGGILTFLGFLYILYFTINIYEISKFGLIIYFTLIILRLIYQFIYWFHKEYIDEVFADFFALTFLTSKECAEIEQNVKNLSVITRNKNLFNCYSKKREYMMRNSLKLKKEDKRDDFFEYMAQSIRPKNVLIQYLIAIAIYSSFAIWPHKDIDSLSFIIWPTIILFIFFLIAFISSTSQSNKVRNALDYLSENKISI